ncbi:LIC_13387 family protein [Solimonas fluminis]|nr:hypothetical protein [Solimonas fluminis]
MNIPGVLVAAGALIMLALGTAHLVFTFFGPKLLPRDPSLIEHMKAVSPVITRETTIWRAWIGFNATHSYSAMLFGLVWGYLGLAWPELLFGSAFLSGLGLVTLLAYIPLGRLYFFSLPFRGILLANALYVSGLVLAHT